MLAGLITPKIGLKLVKSAIENQLKRKIDGYDLKIDNLNKSVVFTIDGKNYPYESGQSLCEAIIMMVREKISNFVIDFVIIHYYGETKEPLIDIYFKDEKGNKRTENIEL